MPCRAACVARLCRHRRRRRKEPDYIRQQRQRLEAVKRREADIVAGNAAAPGVDAREPARTLSILAALGAAGAASWYVWTELRQADRAANRAFVEQKALEEGVVKLSSGLLYKVLQKGSGGHHPSEDSPCACHYRGTLIDGTEFDSSYSRGAPSTFAPNQVIPGWTQALQLMVEGDKWELTVPSELGYGRSGKGDDIPGGATLVFEMELVRLLARDTLETRTTATLQKRAGSFLLFAVPSLPVICVLWLEAGVTEAAACTLTGPALSRAVVAGFLLWLARSRARCKDSSKASHEPTLEEGSDGHGFIEAGASFGLRKTGTQAKKSGMALPLVASPRGISRARWAEAWLSLRRRADLAAEKDGCLQPEVHAWTTTDATSSRLRALTSEPELEAVLPKSFSSRSARAAVLSWAAKAGLSVVSRRLLGGHADMIAKSALEFSRGDLAGALHQLRRVFDLIGRSSAWTLPGQASVRVDGGGGGESGGDANFRVASEHENTDSDVEGGASTVEVAAAASAGVELLLFSREWGLEVRCVQVTLHVAMGGCDDAAACGFTFAMGMAERWREGWPPAAQWLFLCGRGGCFRSHGQEVFVARVVEGCLEDCIPTMTATNIKTYTGVGFGTVYNPQDENWKRDLATGFMKQVSEASSAKSADISTGLLLDYALKRRGLIMAMGGLVEFEEHEKRRETLMSPDLRVPPTVYAKTSLTQVRRADEAAFALFSRLAREGIRRKIGVRPLDSIISDVRKHEGSARDAPGGPRRGQAGQESGPALQLQFRHPGNSASDDVGIPVRFGHKLNMCDEAPPGPTSSCKRSCKRARSDFTFALSVVERCENLGAQLVVENPSKSLPLHMQGFVGLPGRAGVADAEFHACMVVAGFVEARRLATGDVVAVPREGAPSSWSMPLAASALAAAKKPKRQAEATLAKGAAVATVQLDTVALVLPALEKGGRGDERWRLQLASPTLEGKSVFGEVPASGAFEKRGRPAGGPLGGILGAPMRARQRLQDTARPGAPDVAEVAVERAEGGSCAGKALGPFCEGTAASIAGNDQVELITGKAQRGRHHRGFASKASRNLRGRALDLTPVFKQLAPLPPPSPLLAAAPCSCLARNGVARCVLRAIPVEARGAFYVFGAVARAIEMILSELFLLVLAQCAGDFPQLKPEANADSAAIAAGVMQPWGWGSRRGAAGCLPRSSFSALGAAFDLSSAAGADLMTSNELERAMRASEQACVLAGGVWVNQPVLTQLLARGPPPKGSMARRWSNARRRSRCRSPPALLWVDGSEKQAVAEGGAVLGDRGAVSECIQLLQPAGGGPPAAVALAPRRAAARGRRAIAFVDDDAARAAEVNGHAGAPAPTRLAGTARALAPEQRAHLLFDQAPLPSNVTDGPSRGKVENAERLGFVRARAVFWSFEFCAWRKYERTLELACGGLVAKPFSQARHFQSLRSPVQLRSTWPAIVTVLAAVGRIIIRLGAGVVGPPLVTLLLPRAMEEDVARTAVEAALRDWLAWANYAVGEDFHVEGEPLAQRFPEVLSARGDIA
ncbi:unnamed protein product [Prorocentrum cordatum]|uniref:peptidylprolyl isomerase n=1 Tax=Prorocentrum cordatum TaxID=2364126 RepID=A0ABN9SGE3_9DINO|nr:unnamed protein product [Polarella glacialis]